MDFNWTCIHSIVDNNDDLEKKIRELTEKFQSGAKIQRPKVCIRCMNGESGHITHKLEPMPMDSSMDVDYQGN